MGEKNRMDCKKPPHWISRGYIGNERTIEMLVCSVCRAEFSFDYETGIGPEDWNFCPNCGAKMKGSVKDGRE